MDQEQLWMQVFLVALKEGVNFLSTNIKDRITAQKKLKEIEKDAQAIAVQTRESEDATLSSKLHWEKVGTLYWLGNDLMWVQDMMYRGASPERVLQGVRIAIRYTQELGFQAGSFVDQQLSLCITMLEPLVGISGSSQAEIDLLRQHYTAVEQYVQSVKWYLNALVAENQPGFEKLRAL